LKTFEVLRLIFSHSVQQSIVPFIHSLAPRMIQIVNFEIDRSVLENLTKSKYNLILIGLDVLEILVRSTTKSKIQINQSFFQYKIKSNLICCFIYRFCNVRSLHSFVDEATHRRSKFM
jgi:16S rRNA A1518/A1519 N6-dimethyltransferase RsmA/KsgA/DIM1 with predicted DNA glycosylase/AP lyase activity